MQWVGCGNCRAGQAIAMGAEALAMAGAAVGSSNAMDGGGRGRESEV